jgi:hypothetical protein
VTEGEDERAERAARAPPHRSWRPSARSLRSTRRLDYAVGGLTVGLFLTGQLVFLEGPHPHDPARYFQTAVTFPDIGADLFTLRVGVVAPMLAAVLAFGPSEAAFYAVPLVSGMVLVGAVYATMLVLFHDRVLAAAAALVTGLNVHYLLNSSHTFPDVVVTATFTVAFLCLLLAGRRLEENRGHGHAQTALIVCAGVLLGWSYLAREFSPTLLPVVVALLIAFRYPLSQIAVLAVSAVATVAVEPLYGLVGRGEPFVRWQLLLSRAEFIDPRKEDRMEFIQGQLNGLPDTLIVFPRLLLAWASGWTFFLLVGALLVALALFRDRRLWLLFIWSSSVFLAMAAVGLGSLSSGAWILNITNIRYWYPILPPLAMGAFGGLWLLLRARFSGRNGEHVARGATLVLAAAILVPGFVEFAACSEKEGWKTDPAKRWHELRSWFSTPEAARFEAVFTDWTSWRLLPAYTSSTFGRARWNGQIQTLEPVGGFVPTERLETSLLLVHKDRWGTSTSTESQWKELNDEWSPVFVTGDQRMVVLAHETALGGAPVPAEADWWRTSPVPANTVPPGTCGISPYEPPD